MAPNGPSVRPWFAERQRLHHHYEGPRCWGRSSDALALYGVGIGLRPQTPGWSDTGSSWTREECGQDYPHDEGDLRACELTYDMADVASQMRMLPVLEEFRRWVREGLNRYGVAHPYKRESAA